MESHPPLSGVRIMGLIIGTELLGSERGNIEALRALQTQGAQIFVIVSSRAPGGGAVGDHCRQLGFTTLEIPYGSHFSAQWILQDSGYRWRQLKRLISNSRQLHQIIRSHHPDLLLLGNTLAYAFIALALKWNRIPVVFRMGDAPMTESRFQFLLWKSLARRANHIVCVSQFIQQQAELNLSKTRPTTVIYNIAPKRNLDIDRIQINELLKTKRPNQGVYVGQISPIKGVPDLINALIQLDDPHTGCWIIGGSAHSKELEETLRLEVNSSTTKTKIEFLGYVSDPRPFLKAADWHIAPSTCQEALGNVVQEAKAQGTPSIVSPRGGLPETITARKTGWLMSDIGENAIVSCIQEAQSDTHILKTDDILKESKRMNNPSHFQTNWRTVIQTVLNT